MAVGVGFEVVWESITKELIPWLQGDGDPVALRARS